MECFGRGGGDEEYESNIGVRQYDKDGNLTDIYSLANNPSGLLAMASTEGLGRPVVTPKPTGKNPDGSK